MLMCVGAFSSVCSVLTYQHVEEGLATLGMGPVQH